MKRSPWSRESSAPSSPMSFAPPFAVQTGELESFRVPEVTKVLKGWDRQETERAPPTHPPRAEWSRTPRSDENDNCRR